jgi:hypothetical protein
MEESMRKQAMAIGLALIGTMAFSMTNIYRNMGTLTQSGFYYASPNEHGDDLTLVGGTSVTLITVPILNFDDPIGTSNPNVKAIVRLYDDANFDGIPDGPALFTSGPIPCHPDIGTVSVAPASPVATSGQVIVTIQLQNGPNSGMLIANPPEIGSSQDYFVENDPGMGGWTGYYFGGSPVANFNMSVWTNGQPNRVYDNRLNSTGYYFPNNNENGDIISLEGTDRVIDKLSVGIGADLAIPQGDETVRIRLYNCNAMSANGFLAPGTLLADSGPIAIPGPGGWEIEIELLSLNLVALDTIHYTVQMGGMAGVAGDQAGLLMYDPGTSGFSENYFNIKDYPGYPGWNTFWFGGNPPANFYSSLKTTGGANEVVVCPTTFQVIRGIYISGNAASLCSADSDNLVVRRARAAALTGFEIWFAGTGTSSIRSSVTEVEVNWTGRSTLGGVTYQIRIQRKVGGSAYSTLKTGTVGTTVMSDSAKVSDVGLTPSDFVDPNNGNVTPSMYFLRSGFVPAGWQTENDVLTAKVSG